MEERITDLPEEIITLILITLPIKTIVQLKCVCKFFKEFISAPEFAKQHLKFSIQHDSSGYTVMAHNAGGSRIMQLHLMASQPHYHFTGRGDVINYDYFERHYYGEYYDLNERPPGLLVGSCHGLLCSITDSKDCVLWNPCVVNGKEIMFNKLPHPVDFTQDCLDIMYALGYDKIDDDYKVVAFCVFKKQHDEQEQQDEYYSVPTVFSLKRNSWSRINGTSRFGGVVDSYAKFADGKIYWLTDTKYRGEVDYLREAVYFEEREIVCFDVHKEVLEIVEQPCYGGTGPYGLALGEANGSIAVLCHQGSKKSNADIWVMRRDGKHSCSWTKLGTTPSRLKRIYNPCVRSCSTLPEGAILLFTGGVLEFYHPQYNKSWEDSTNGLYSSSCCSYHFQPLVYVENLVSPFQTS